MLPDPLPIQSLPAQGGLNASSTTPYVFVVSPALTDLSPGKTVRAIPLADLANFNVSAPTGVVMKAGNVSIAHSVSGENKGQNTTRVAVRVDATKVVSLTGMASTAQATLTMSLPDIAWSPLDVITIVNTLVGLVYGCSIVGGHIQDDSGVTLTRILAGEP
jgi:hypothetical protein